MTEGRAGLCVQPGGLQVTPTWREATHVGVELRQEEAAAVKLGHHRHVAEALGDDELSEGEGTSVRGTSFTEPRGAQRLKLEQPGGRAC